MSVQLNPQSITCVIDSAFEKGALLSVYLITVIMHSAKTVLSFRAKSRNPPNRKPTSIKRGFLHALRLVEMTFWFFTLSMTIVYYRRNIYG